MYYYKPLPFVIRPPTEPLLTDGQRAWALKRIAERLGKTVEELQVISRNGREAVRVVEDKIIHYYPLAIY